MNVWHSSFLDGRNIRISISSILLIIIVILMCLSSTIYAFSYYSGLEDKVKIFRLIILFFLFFSFFSGLLYWRKLLLTPSIALFSILIVLCTYVSIILNNPIEYIPSLLRFLLYILAANLMYRISGLITLQQLLSFFKHISYLFLIISILFGYFEIIIGDVQYINGDFRVAGPFKKHQLAFAMFLFVNLVLFIEFNMRSKKRKYKRLLDTIIFLLSFYLFIRTGSRALIVIFFLSYFALILFKAKSVWSVFKGMVAGFSVAVLLIIIITNTGISPRLKLIFTSKDSIYDPSTMTRLMIIQNSLEAFDEHNKFIGIGLGGFHEFYYEISGRKGFAAHNNYLLFLIEGGYIGLTIFLLYQIVTFIVLLRFFRKYPNQFSRTAFLLFIGVDILCFLQNNYYFYTSELIIWMIYGVAFYFKKEGYVNERGIST